MPCPWVRTQILSRSFKELMEDLDLGMYYSCAFSMRYQRAFQKLNAVLKNKKQQQIRSENTSLNAAEILTIPLWHFFNWVSVTDVNVDAACVDLTRSTNLSRYLNNTGIIWIPASRHLCM